MVHVMVEAPVPGRLAEEWGGEADAEPLERKNEKPLEPGALSLDPSGVFRPLLGTHSEPPLVQLCLVLRCRDAASSPPGSVFCRDNGSHESWTSGSDPDIQAPIGATCL